MTEEVVNVEEIKVNRRFDTRHKTKTQVFVIHGGKRVACTAINISTSGAAVVTETPLGLRPGIVCELAFAINLGKISKLHRRIAKVVHVSNGTTGFMMDKYEGK